MGGVVKGIKKVFKAVGSFVKKYWKVIVIAAAIYFTCGMAMAAMPAAGTVATTGVAAGVEAGAGYGALATGAAATAEAGSMTAALGITTAAGYGAAGAAMTAAEFTAAGGVAAGVGLGASELAGAGAAAGGAAAAEGMPGITSSLEGTGMGASEATTGAITDFSGGAADFGADAGGGGLPGITSPVEGAGAAPAGTAAGGGSSAGGSLLSKAGGAVKGFWGGMSTGEKLMFASTAFQTLSGALQDPSRASEGLWPGGAYFGMDEKGNKTDLAGAYAQGLQGNNVDGSPGAGTAPPAAAATQKPVQPGQMAAGGQMSATGDENDVDTSSTAASTQANGMPTAAAGAAAGSPAMPAAGSGAASMQRANATTSSNLASASSRNEKFFDDLRDRLDANHA
jgi:hypothetical protein